MPELRINSFNGVNYNDMESSLISRAFQFGQQGPQQVAPLEMSELNNVDLTKFGIIKRKGSTESDDLTGVMVSNESLIRGVEWPDPVTGTKIEVVVGAKSIYTNQTGSFVQMADFSDAGTAYTHASDVSKVTFAMVDGHLFIGLDGANNYIQVYRSGAALDNEMNATNVVLTGTIDPAASTSVVGVGTAFTTELAVGSQILVTGETRTVATITDDTNLTVTAAFTDNANDTSPEMLHVYEEAYSATTHVITGTWPKAAYLVSAVQSRLFYGIGDPLIEFSPIATASSSGIWDAANSGFYAADGDVRSLTGFSPDFTDSVNELIYIGTSAGFVTATGFGSSDNLFKIEKSRGPMNHQLVTKTKNWLVYLADDRNIYGVNGSTVIDLGRRLRNDDALGVLENLDLSSTKSTGFAAYDANKRKVYIHVTRSATNDHAIVLDLQLGEPVKGAPERTFEQSVRLLQWNIWTGSWFSGIYFTDSGSLGIMADGKTWNLNTSEDDKDSTLINAYFTIPDFTGGSENLIKQWRRILTVSSRLAAGTVLYDDTESDIIWADTIDDGDASDSIPFLLVVDGGDSEPASDTNVKLTRYYNGETFSSDSDTFTFSTSDLGYERKSVQMNRRSQSVSVKYSNNVLNETFQIKAVEIRYDFGGEVRI